MGEFEERVWWTAENPRHMLRMSRLRPNGRKYLLLACAIVRHVIPGARSEFGGQILDALERFAFAQPAKGVKTHLWREVIRSRFPDMPSPLNGTWRKLGDDLSWAHAFSQRLHALNRVSVADVNVVLAVMPPLRQVEVGPRVADLVREVFANPRRQVAFDPAWLMCNNGAAKYIAEQIAATGNFSDMPILADALEDAGCRDDEVLRHCRESHAHVPGCWALDAVLGRG